jgi:ABC-type amino acid transport substrate-binding protein
MLTLFALVQASVFKFRGNHLYEDADIVIGMEADWPPYNNIVDGQLTGFDVELT